MAFDFGGMGALLQGAAQGVSQGANLVQVAQNVKLRQQKIDMDAQLQKAKLEQEKNKLAVDTFKTGLDLMDNSKSFKQFSKADKTRILQKTTGAMGVAFGFDIQPDQLEWDDNFMDPVKAISEIYNDQNLDDATKRQAIAGKLLELDGGDRKQADFLRETVRFGLGGPEQTTRELEGDKLLSEFATDKVLRMSGLTDEQIKAGRASGRIPKRLSKRDAQAIMPRDSLSGFLGTLRGRGGAPANQGPLNADSFSEGLGF